MISNGGKILNNINLVVRRKSEKENSLLPVADRFSKKRVLEVPIMLPNTFSDFLEYEISKKMWTNKGIIFFFFTTLLNIINCNFFLGTWCDSACCTCDMLKYGIAQDYSKRCKIT